VTSVNILLKINSEECLQTALLVFRTIRIGFPTSSITVFGNGFADKYLPVVQQACVKVDACFVPIKRIPKGEFIEKLIFAENKPFWMMDTDVVLFEKMEDWFNEFSEDLFAGRFEPEFYDDWSRSVHMARIHPSVMWVNPVKLRCAMRNWPGLHYFFRSVEIEYCRWHFVPVMRGGKQEILFYDVAAGLHHAFGGTHFTGEQNGKFAHLFCGSYSNLIKEHLDLTDMHKAVCANPNLARGLWKQQQEWYKSKRVGQTLG
jgi:hypothetical protein